jgi:hypothetical protein
MSFLADLQYRLRALFRRREMDAELAAELDHHLATQAAIVDYRSLTKTFSDAAGWWRTEFVIDGDGGREPIRVNGVEVTSNFFD